MILYLLEKMVAIIKYINIECPNCHSTNIKAITGTERAMSIMGLGIFSKKINKSFECENCGYTW